MAAMISGRSRSGAMTASTEPTSAARWMLRTLSNSAVAPGGHAHDRRRWRSWCDGAGAVFVRLDSGAGAVVVRERGSGRVTPNSAHMPQFKIRYDGRWQVRSGVAALSDP